ncbi:hypothetical protein [Duganella vulcania]|uniref:Uncharacterized protein n=1 Tax=Duganella vulcania TaxID=2692166 RepID=A0A845GCY0_9BURK|nr:hypothetical protein [Duganella vulcania]MYM92473.1 hypothetical protein [Duganella vulcania]
METNALDRLIEALKAQIGVYKLELLQHYPNDLLVHDRASFERFWAPGQRFGWMVGHRHTHMAAIGLHVEENKVLGYLLNLAADDRFFEIAIGQDGQSFSIKEIGREGFRSLMNTPVPYHRMGQHENFTLYRAGGAVGSVVITPTGTYEMRVYKAVLAPKAGSLARDATALHLWSDYACRGLAGSLFYRSEYVVTPPSAVLLVA